MPAAQVYPEQPPQHDPSFWRPGEPGWGDRSGYRAAAVCKRGHLQESELMGALPPEQLGFCPGCGASILSRCAACGIRIRGNYYAPGVIGGFIDVPAKFCDSCGEPYPWATRQDRIYQLENLLDEEDIDEYTKLLVREDLERLRMEGAELDQQAELAIWRRVKSRAPGLLGGAASNIAQSLLNAYLRQRLGLPAS